MTTILLVSIALRASVVLLAGLVTAAALARASAATRRSVLVIALGGSLFVPVLTAFGPSWRVETPGLAVVAHESPLEGSSLLVPTVDATVPSTKAKAANAPASVKSGVGWPLALAGLWLAGALLVAARAWRANRRAQALVHRSQRVTGHSWEEVVRCATREAGAKADVCLCDAVGSPAVTGAFAPTILLPKSAENWTRARRRVVLVHELAHVRHRDGIAQLVADIASACYWFNPLAWHCARRLRVERELAADDAVLGVGVLPSFYAEELLVHARGEARGALAMAERSSLADRVVAILAPERVRGELAGRGKLLLGGSTVLVVATAATLVPSAPALASTEAFGGVDAAMQAAAEEELPGLVATANGESATVLVLDASTGAVLADAGRRGGLPFDVARSVALTPGSTLKAITLAAALETNAIQPRQTFPCGPQARVYSEGELHDSSPGTTDRNLDAAHMLAVSSNIGLSHVFDALGGDRLGAWLGRFHFGESLALPAAGSGVVPAGIVTGTLRGAQVATGEGMTATPLQIAAAYAALADDGVYHAPTFGGPAAPGERVVSSATAHEVMTILATVVEDDSGTGRLAQVAGAHVAGKTGTAEWTAADGREHRYASFVGAADVRGHRVVVLVGVETLRQDVWGGGVAAPVFAHLVARLR